MILELCEPGTSVITPYINAKTSMVVACKEGHERKILPGNLKSKGTGKRCKLCNPITLKKSSEEFSKEIAQLILLGTYEGAHIPVLVKNVDCNHEYLITPTNILSKGIGSICRVCTSRAITPPDLSSLGLTEASPYLGSRTRMQVTNQECGHTYSIIPNNTFSRGDGVKCRVCFPSTSKGELELREFISSIYSYDIVTNDRSVLNGKEIDILLPDIGRGFEFNGLWYHNEQHVGKYHMYDKTVNAAAKGIRLVHVNEDEWNNKKDIVKSRISYMLGVKTTKVYARITIVAKLKYPREFLDTNHIQGAGAPTSINYGLFLEDELVAVMTFGKARFTKNHDYELVRYCSLLNVAIVGGASKLLKAFEKDFTGKSIVSYSDRRWSNGLLYRSLGFKHDNTSTPGYEYFKGNTKLTRYQCQKHLLKDRFPDFYKDELSEVEILKLAGYYRVYNSGQDRWIK